MPERSVLFAAAAQYMHRIITRSHSVGDGARFDNIAFLPSARDVEALLDQAHVPAVAIALVRDCRLAFSAGFGALDSSGRQPASETTIFAAMSLSKPVFAYAVMVLRQLGRARLAGESGGDTARHAGRRIRCLPLLD